MRRCWLFLCWMLDLVCADGDPDYAKMMQTGTQLTLLAMLWQGKEVPFALGLTLIISAHGTRVLMAAIKSGVFRVGASVLESRRTEKIDHTITERRDPALGVEPAP